jgi:hypothetical protein
MDVYKKYIIIICNRVDELLVCLIFGQLVEFFKSALISIIERAQGRDEGK